MARPLRIDIEDGVYHVITRGIDRNTIFRSDLDRKHWLDLMAEAHVRFRLRFFAYVLMDNHVHLIVQTPDANLSRAVQWIKVSYSMWFNAKYRRVGPLFQGRFKSVLVDELDGWLLDLSFYVHLNPVRLKMYGLDDRGKKLESMGLVSPTADEVKARMATLRSFRWSSYRYYGGYVRGIPKWLDMRAVLSRCPQDDPVKFYRTHARWKVSGGFDADFMESLANGIALGSAAFLEKVKAIGGEPVRDVANKKELRSRISWERLIQAAEEVRGEDWAVFGSRRGDLGKAVVFLLARRYCAMSLKEIGEAAGGVDYAAVSDRIRRYEKMGKKSDLEAGIEEVLNLET